MTTEKRVGLFNRLVATPEIGWMVKLISSEEIAEKMMRRVPISLNAISHDCAMELVQSALKDGVKITRVIVDTVGDPASYQRKLFAAFDGKIEFLVEKKADANHKPVSAASICAKVLRDESVEAWEWCESGQESRSTLWGSGYPSDPKTVAWLKTNTNQVFGYPNVVRFSWAPVKALLKDLPEVANVEWSDDEEEDPAAAAKAAAAAGTAKLTSFFTAAPRKSTVSGGTEAKKPRLAPFRKRKLVIAEDF